tara:strand:- start:161 stop:820 length:660 start_codon:yes stop_codon:yes gene_type:complete
MNDLTKLVPNIELDVGVDKDDVIAVAVSSHETKLRDAKRRLDDADSQHCKERDKAKKKLHKEVQHEMDTYFYFKRNKLIDALGELGSSQCSTKMEYDYNKSVSTPDKSVYTFRLQITLGKTDSWQASHLSFTHEHIFWGDDNVVNQLHLEIEARQEDSSSVRAHALEISTRLRDLSSIERNARGAIARHALKQSEAGRNILSQIEDVQPDHIQLPIRTD